MKNSQYKLKPFDLKCGYYIDDNALFVIECLLKGQYNSSIGGILTGIPAEWTSIDFFRFLLTLDEKYPLEFKSLELLHSFDDELEGGIFSGRGVDYVARFLDDEMFEAESVVVDKFLKETKFFIKDVRDILLKGMETDHISLDDLKTLLDNLNAVAFKGIFGNDISYLEEFIEVVRVFINCLNCTVSFKKSTSPKIKADLENYIDQFRRDELYGSGTFLLEAGVFKYSTNVYSFKYHKKLLLEELEKNFEHYAHKFFKLTDFVHKHDILKESGTPLKDTREAYEGRQFLFTHILKSFELSDAIFIQTYFVKLEDWTAVELGCFLNIKDLALISEEAGGISPSIKLTNEGIIVNDKAIKLFAKKESREYNFIKVVFSDPSKLWNFDEIAEKLEIRDYAEKENWKGYNNRFYQYSTTFNKKVAINAGINDLLDFSKKTVQIRGKYLP